MHSGVYVEEQEPTCGTPGRTEADQCEWCQQILYGGEPIEPTGEHDPVIDPAVAPENGQPGLSEGSHCSICGTVLIPQEIVPWSCETHEPENVPAKAPTRTEPGYTAYTACALCHMRLTDATELPPIPASWDIRLPEATASVGSEAFSGIGGVNSILVPVSCTSIGDAAFSGLGADILYVAIENGSCSISTSAFNGCGNVIVIASAGSSVAAWAQQNGFISASLNY